MKFKVNKASGFLGDDYEVEVEVSSLLDLQKIQDEHGHELIVDFHDKTIMIYDDFLE